MHVYQCMKAFLIYLLLVSPIVGIGQDVDSQIKKSIFFGGGSYYIDEAQQKELQQFIEGISQLDLYDVVIFSHTDNIGGKVYNEWLSGKRSEAVYEDLLRIGVAEEQIKIKNLGFENPVYTNQSANGRMMNRRVDIILVPLAF